MARVIVSSTALAFLSGIGIGIGKRPFPLWILRVFVRELDMNVSRIETVLDSILEHALLSLFRGGSTVQLALAGVSSASRAPMSKLLVPGRRQDEMSICLEPRWFACRTSGTPNDPVGDANTVDNDIVEDDFDALSSGLSICQEYKTLSQLPELTPQQAQRLAVILELATYDASLAHWIEKSDKELFGLEPVATQEGE
ncbi:MAG: hypothetical protein AAF959_10960 [Cyanobacteria bacterium P01_D01_bin.56]